MPVTPIRQTLAVGPIDVHLTLRFVAILTGDPTVRLGPWGFERATRTPNGPASIRVRWDQTTAEVDVWGEGAEWVVARASALLGCDDDVSGFDPAHPVLRATWAGMSGQRMCRTGTLWHDLAWFIVQQRVRFADAANSWRSLVRQFGEPAPGPVDLLLPPAADRIGALGYHELHPLGIERNRATTLIRTARAVHRLSAKVDLPFAEVEPRLRALPGVGPWTTAGLASLTWGDADAVIVGDAGIPSLASWVLAREPWGDDERLIELLEPYRPHRYRVIQLLWASGLKPPRKRPTPYGTNDIRRR